MQLPADDMYSAGTPSEGLRRQFRRMKKPKRLSLGGCKALSDMPPWGAAMQAQINWWSPVWPLAAKRTMGFYPSYWSRPLENTTGQWRFADFLAARKKCAPGEAAAYPSAPKPLQQPNESPVPVLINVGDLLVFSSAHLHSSIANQTALTRFSLEIRTISGDDLRTKRGAPNVDCQSHPPLCRLFRGIIDGAPPPESYF